MFLILNVAQNMFWTLHRLDLQPTLSNRCVSLMASYGIQGEEEVERARPFPNSHSPPPVFPLALFMFRLGTRVARLGTAAATRAPDSEPGPATRQGDSDTREAPRGGEGDDSLLRVARAGADSPLRDAPRPYRGRRHFVRGPFLNSQYSH